jgi:hypothetical protein
LLDHLAGTVQLFRTLSPCERKPALTGPGQPLTRKLCRAVWGHLLDYLPARAEETIRACGGFAKDKTNFQHFSKDLKFELGIVTYNGTGKYRTTDVVAPWSAVPEDVRGIPQGSEHGILLHHLEQIASWWPVVCVRSADEQTMTAMGMCGGGVIVICIYRLMWDVPAAWSARVIPISRL